MRADWPERNRPTHDSGGHASQAAVHLPEHARDRQARQEVLAQASQGLQRRQHLGRRQEELAGGLRPQAPVRADPRHSPIALANAVHDSYGANLRAYYKEWKRQQVKPSFWEWLDDESVEVEGVPRTKLERETVLYCDTAAERQKFALSVQDGLIVRDGDQLIVETGDDGWIFVLRDGVLYGGQKETKKIPRVHHTSFVGGECVQTAGMMVIVNGSIKTIYPHSGHYRPSEYEVLVLLRFLVANKVPLEDIQVDVQRIQKVFRDTVNGSLVRKLDNAHFWNAPRTLYFLELKHLAWKSGLFDQLGESVAKKMDMVGSPTSASSPPGSSVDVTMSEFHGDSAAEVGVTDSSRGLFFRSGMRINPMFEDSTKLLATCGLQP